MISIYILDLIRLIFLISLLIFILYRFGQNCQAGNFSWQNAQSGWSIGYRSQRFFITFFFDSFFLVNFVLVTFFLLRRFLTGLWVGFSWSLRDSLSVFLGVPGLTALIFYESFFTADLLLSVG